MKLIVLALSFQFVNKEIACKLLVSIIIIIYMINLMACFHNSPDIVTGYFCAK